MSLNSIEKLRKFGYEFNQDGKLCKIDEETGKITNLPFQFKISSDDFVNQKNYEDLGSIIEDYVYDLLELNGLTRHYIPKDVPENEAAFIFATFEEIREVENLLIIIHGSGVVRAGQWSRSLIINDSLNSGTVLPYIKKAIESGFEVIVTNTNDNYRDGCAIEESSSPKEHIETVWKSIVQKINPKRIAIVAHSYGGCVTINLAKKFEKDFDEKVYAVVFTDSVHNKSNVSARLKEVGVNFVTSTTPLNKLLLKNDDQIEERSAGTDKHERTSFACIENAFEFINQKMSE